MAYRTDQSAPIFMIIRKDGISASLPRTVFNFADGRTATAAFDERTWSWFLLTPDGGSKKLDGVSGVVKISTPAKPLMIWAVRVALARARELLVSGGYVLTDQQIEQHPLHVEILDKILERARKEDNELLEEAGSVGHIAHKHLENLVKATLTGDTARYDELLGQFPVDERAASAVVGALEWWSNHDVQWVYTERPVMDLEYLFAGTTDGVAYVSSCSDKSCCPVEFRRRFSLVDFKTSNALRVSYLWQAAAYRHCIQKLDGLVVEDTWILRLDKEDATFDPWHVEGQELFEEDFRGYLNALACVRSLRGAEERIHGVMSARRAVAAEEKAIAKAEADKIACPKSTEYKGIRLSRCFEDGTQCQKCKSIYEERHK